MESRRLIHNVLFNLMLDRRLQIGLIHLYQHYYFILTCNLIFFKGKNLINF